MNSNPWKGLQKLQVLRLNHNHISSLALLWPIPTLEELYLQSNRFSAAAADANAALFRPAAAGGSSPGRPVTPSTLASRGSGGSAFLVRIAALAPNLQILDVSDNGADIISSYADLSTLLRCPGLVELSLKGSCHYTDRRTHCLSVQSQLPNLEVLDGQPIAVLEDSLRASVSSRGSLFSPALSAQTPLFQRVAHPGLGNGAATPRTPGGAGMVTFDSRRPGSARSVRDGWDMAASFSGGVREARPAPVMRPPSARTGGFDKVWSLEEAERKHQEFLQSLQRLKDGCEARLHSMQRAYSEVFEPSPRFTAGPSPPQPTLPTPAGRNAAHPVDDPQRLAAPMADDMVVEDLTASLHPPEPPAAAVAPQPPLAPASGTKDAAGPAPAEPGKVGPRAAKRAGRAAKTPPASLEASPPTLPDAALKRTHSQPLVLASALQEAAAPPKPRARATPVRVPSPAPGEGSLSSPKPFLPALSLSSSITSLPFGGPPPPPPAPAGRPPGTSDAPRAARRGSDGGRERELVKEKGHKSKARSVSSSPLFRFTPTVLADFGAKLGVPQKPHAAPPKPKAPHHLPASQSLRLSSPPQPSPPVPLLPSASCDKLLGPGGRVRTPPLGQPAPLRAPPGPLLSEADFSRCASSPGILSGDVCAATPPPGTPPQAPVLSHPASDLPQPRQSMSCETQTGDDGPSEPKSRCPVEIVWEPSEAAGLESSSQCQTDAIVGRLPPSAPRPGDRPFVRLTAQDMAERAEDSSLDSDEDSDATDSESEDEEPPPVQPHHGPAADVLVIRAGSPPAVATASSTSAAAPHSDAPTDTTGTSDPSPASTADGSLGPEEEEAVADVAGKAVATLHHRKGQLRGPIAEVEKQGYKRFATPRQSTSFDAPRYRAHPLFQRPPSAAGSRPSTARSPGPTGAPAPAAAGARSLTSAGSTRSLAPAEGGPPRRPSVARNLNKR
eukprot:EG_transcript_890